MLSGLSRLFREVPECPLCDGPCTHEFERSEWVFPDHLPQGDPANRTADPEPVKETKPNRRGRRPEVHTPKGPEEDRMVKPSEDR